MEAIPRPPNPCPEDMKNTEVHPIELALVAGLVVLEAVVVLVAAVVALVVTLAQWRPAAAPAPAAALVLAPTPIEPIPARPQPHPISALADRLAELNVATLRTMANIHNKRVLKADLIAMVIACS